MSTGFAVSGPETEAAAKYLRRATAEAAHTGLPATTPLRPLQQVAIIGAGTMGSGIAMAMTAANLPI